MSAEVLKNDSAKTLWYCEIQTDKHVDGVSVRNCAGGRRMEENCSDRCGNPKLQWQKKEETQKLGERARGDSLSGCGI